MGWTGTTLHFPDSAKESIQKRSWKTLNYNYHGSFFHFQHAFRRRTCAGACALRLSPSLSLINPARSHGRQDVSRASGGRAWSDAVPGRSGTNPIKAGSRNRIRLPPWQTQHAQWHRKPRMSSTNLVQHERGAERDRVCAEKSKAEETVHWGVFSKKRIRSRSRFFFLLTFCPALKSWPYQCQPCLGESCRQSNCIAWGGRD